MRVLVTGGLGFIGSHIVDQLVGEGHEVVVLDSLEPDAHRVEPEVDPRVDLRRHSVCDADATRDAARGCDAVCHQAAKVGLGVDFSDVVDYVHHNDIGTATLLRVLHDLRFRGRYVFASSMVVYGEGAYSCDRDGPVRPGPRDPASLAAGRFEPPCPSCGRPLNPSVISEDAPLAPRNVYAATKLHQEHLAEAFALEHPGVVSVALRYHNVYGPRMPRDTPYAGVASIFRSALARGESPKVFEDGGQRRDFVHVTDVARANVLALTGPEVSSGAMNIASGAPHTILELAEALADAAGPGAPRPEVVGGSRAGDVRHVVASPERARCRLGFEARVGFADGMTELAAAPLRD
jgi:dTDP-L-rhamnose 4-epimerase